MKKRLRDIDNDKNGSTLDKGKGEGSNKLSTDRKSSKTKTDKECNISIDDLFDTAKETVKKIKTERAAKEKIANEILVMEREERRRLKACDNVNNAKPTRFDSDLGLPIYRESDLRIGQGGGTSDCPFDCSCCF